MKTNLLKSIGLALLLALPTTGRAADTTPPPAPPAPKTFELHFPGGTLGDLLNAIETASGEKLNTIVPQPFLESRMPAMELRSVTVFQILESLNVTHFREIGQWANMGNVWVLRARTESRQAKAFFVGHLLAKFSVQDVTTAIRTTWDFGSQAERAELKYHEETQLLIALADKEALTTAADVLSELEKALPKPRAAVRY